MVSETELKRIKSNFEKIKDEFDLIDEQIDESLKVSGKTLNFYINI